MISVGLIGCGGIAQDLVTALGNESPPPEVRIVAALVRPGRTEAARQKLAQIEIVETLDQLLAHRPELIAEVAGQQAVAQYGETVLRNGVDLVVISVGALADAALFDRLKSAAQARLSLVRYRSRKPPLAWRGSPAEKLVDLAVLAKPAVLYRGSAREAALLYPQNANVAAAIAIAGLGFERTEVELVADPAAAGNVHEIEVEGSAGRFAIELEGKPSRTNPKTSALAALSVARAIRNEQAVIVI
jgi:aspartate dehydrogenase